MSKGYPMRTSKHLFDIHEQHEGCLLYAYQCPAGKWTIGLGHTKDVKPGQLCSREQAKQWWREDMAEAEAAVNELVTVPMTQGQFDALASFVFNVGREKFRTSTLLKKLNAEDYAGAAEEFPKWVFAGGKKQGGLVARRADEQNLFLRA